MGIARYLVPPLCVACREVCDPASALCDDCRFELDLSGPIWEEAPPGIDEIVSVTPHEGVGRDLLAAYKFRGQFRLGEFIAARMAEVIADDLGPMQFVTPVPAATLRSRMRGFDTAYDLSRQIAGMLEQAWIIGPIQRTGLGRQRGRGRSGRIGDPPKIILRHPSPEEVLLVDDVTTTGATLSACASALRSGGTKRISAVTFTKRI